MLFSLLYLVVRTIFRLVPADDEFERDVEIMVLPHQVRSFAARTAARSFTGSTSSSSPQPRASCLIHEYFAAAA